MDEDWDAEIDGTSPVNNFHSLSINEINSCPSSKYFNNDYDKNQVNDSFNGFGSHISFDGGNRAFGRGKGRGRGWSDKNTSG